MTQVHQVAILITLAAAASAVACTIIIRALAVIATVNFVRRERRLGRVGAGFLIDLSIGALAISVALVAHLIDIAIWAVLFLVCGEFSNFGTAYLCSAKTFRSWHETPIAVRDFQQAPSTTGGLVQDEGRVELAQDGR